MDRSKLDAAAKQISDYTARVTLNFARPITLSTITRCLMISELREDLRS